MYRFYIIPLFGKIDTDKSLSSNQLYRTVLFLMYPFVRCNLIFMASPNQLTVHSGCCANQHISDCLSFISSYIFQEWRFICNIVYVLSQWATSGVHKCCAHALICQEDAPFTPNRVSSVKVAQSLSAPPRRQLTFYCWAKVPPIFQQRWRETGK